MFANHQPNMKKLVIFQKKIREISRLSLLSFAFLLFGITAFTLPATAANSGNNSVLVSLVSGSSSAILNPTFRSSKS